MTEYASEKVKQFRRIPGVAGNYRYKELAKIVDDFMEIHADEMDEERPLYEAWVLAHMRVTDGVYIDGLEWWLT